MHQEEIGVAPFAQSVIIVLFFCNRIIVVVVIIVVVCRGTGVGMDAVAVVIAADSFIC